MTEARYIRMIRQALRTRGEATRPQLAKATGLSAVSVSAGIRVLQKQGEVKAEGRVASGGGRPVMLYRYNGNYAQTVWFRAVQEGARIRSVLEICDLSGNTTERHEAEFSYLSEQSLDTRLDAALRRCPLVQISLATTPTPEILPALMCHLSDRYGCPVRLINIADALADGTEETATVYISPGEAPVCSLHLNGKPRHCGDAGLLPGMPGNWKELDFTDLTLTGEMVSRLLLVLSCTLNPKRFNVCGDFRNRRLTGRILYNVSAKLRGNMPQVTFCNISAAGAEKRLRAYAVQLQ